ncbi:MAG: VOC family protein [Gemmatimonadaceae bacterium]
MPPLTGILETALYVDDLSRSRKFYQDLFGFEVVVDVERLVALAVRPGQVLLLFLRGASSQLPHTAHDGSGQLHMAFSIPASAVAEWKTTLRHAGITIEETRTWDAGGESIYFRDPDGHLLELASPGVWSNY